MTKLNFLEQWAVKERADGRTLASMADDCGLTIDRVKAVLRSAFNKMEADDS